MNAHRVEITIDQDGTLILNDIPFQAGDAVEVVILELPTAPNGDNCYPLRGQAVEYHSPSEPVAEN